MTTPAVIPPFTPRLELVCRRCTRAQEFAARDKHEAVRQAKAAGWRAIPGTIGEYCCPKCSTERKPFSCTARRTDPGNASGPLKGGPDKASGPDICPTTTPS